MNLSKWREHLLSVLGLLLFILLLHSLTMPSINAKEAVKDNSEKATPVTITSVIVTDLQETTLVRGEIESPNTPYVAAKVAAEVTDIMVEDGMKVQKGQLLARLDDEAFKIAETKALADQQKMQAMVENQQRRVDRSNDLYSKKLLSQSNRDDVLTSMKQLEAELSAAKSRVNEARYHLSHTRIISPVNGIIQQRMVSTGDFMKVGKLMFHVVAMDKLRARIYFPDTLGDIIHTDMQIILGKGKQNEMGTISHIRPMMEKGNRALHALVEFDNNNNWKPGTSVTAKALLAEHTNVLAVPGRALVRRPAGDVIYKVQGKRVSEQLVKTGLRQNNLVEITAGIRAGEQIVMDGAAWLTDGALVDIQKAEMQETGVQKVVVQEAGISQ